MRAPRLCRGFSAPSRPRPNNDPPKGGGFKPLLFVKDFADDPNTLDQNISKHFPKSPLRLRSMRATPPLPKVRETAHRSTEICLALLVIEC